MSCIMENEINSQAQVIENLIRKYVVNYCFLLDLPAGIKRIVIIASGSSYNAGMYGKYFFENIANLPTSVEHASEFAKSSFSNYEKDTFYIFISQSGQSSDTVECVNKIYRSEAKTLAITNNPNSEIHRMCDYKYDINAGQENAIAATKTFSATVVMLWLIAIKFAQNRKIDVTQETKDIYYVKKNIESFFENIENLDLAVKELSKGNGFAVAGFGINYPLALEASLKIKETSYLHTSCYPLGEFIHGHFALLNETKAFLTFITSDSIEMEHNLLKKILKTYNAKSVVVSDTCDDYGCDILIKFDRGLSKIATIVNMIILVQILALKIAKRLKRNVDSPTGLTKVVENKEE